MKTYLTYGFGIAGACFVWTMIEDVAGLHGAHFNVGQYTHYVTWIIVIAGLWLGIKSVRSASPDQSLTYGRGFWAGMAIAAFYAFGSVISALIFLTYINPGFGDTLQAFQAQKMEQKGMDADQIEKAQKMMHFMFQPIPLSIISFITSLLLGLVVALIVAAILRQDPQDPVAPAEPPPL